LVGIKNTIQEIKKARYEPRKSFKNNQPPDLDICILKLAMEYTSSLLIPG